jgi:uncharacterized protein YhaN
VELTEDRLADGVNVVCGPNEAGKTTLLSVCRALLYGFYPVRDFPYRPWDRDVYPEIEATVALEDGRRADIWRKLTSNPQGSLTMDGQARDLSNHDLPFVQHVERDLYDALYSLTLEDMAALEEKERQGVEDRLLGGFGVEFLRPMSEVIAELNSEAGGLWRPNRRGNQKCRELRERIREVQEKRKEALGRDEQVRDKARRLAELQERLNRISQELPCLQARIEQADQLLPLKQRLEQIARWRKDIPDEEAALSLPDGPVAELRRVREGAEQQWQRLKSLLRDKRKLEETRRAVTPEDEKLLERADDIRAWVRRSGRLEGEAGEIRDLKTDLKHQEQAVREAAEDVLSEPWQEEYEDAVREIAPAELKGRINRYDDAATESQRLAAQTVETVLVGEPLPLWPALVAGGGGLAMLVAGLAASASVVWGVGALALLLGAVLYGIRRHQQGQRNLLEQRKQERTEQLERERAEAERLMEEAREEVAALLADLPVADALLERPDLGLLQQVEKLRSAVQERESLGERLHALQKRHDDASEELDALLEEVGCPPGLAGLDRAERELQEAEERRGRAEEAARRIGEIMEALRHEVVPELRRAREARREVEQQIRAAVPESGPPEEAAERAAEVRKLGERVREAEEELEKEHPDLPELKARLEKLKAEQGDAWQLDAEEVARVRQRADDLQAEREEKRVEAAELEKDIQNARGDVSVAELDGEIERLREELEQARRRRDRLALLESILRRAYTEFRREHQPDVLKRAGRYLRDITQGRYGGLQMMPDDDGQEHLAVVHGDGPASRFVDEPLSGGTLDQIYLAFRLAVVDHLDEGYERLPLFLDEVFVNWDRDRGGRAAELLAKVGERRQVFVLTCHPEWAERVQQATGGALLELPTT